MGKPDKYSLGELIEACIQNTVGPDEAGRISATLALQPGIEDDLRRIGAQVSESAGDSPEFETVASFICYKVGFFTRDASLKGLLAFNLARSMMFSGRLDEAEGALSEAEAHLRSAGDTHRLGSILGTKANIAMQRGDDPVALQSYTKALRLAIEIGDRLGEASNRFGIAQLLLKRGPSPEAHDMLSRALDLYRSIGNKRGEFISLLVLARVCPDEPHQRLKILSQAVAIGRCADMPQPELIHSLGKLGFLQTQVGQWSEAERTLHEGLERAAKEGLRQLEAVFAGNLGAVYAQTGRTEEARQVLTLAATIAAEVGDSEGVMMARKNLAALGQQPRTSPHGASDHNIGEYVDKLLSIVKELRNRLDDIALFSKRAKDLHLPAELHSELVGLSLDRAEALEHADFESALSLVLLLANCPQVQGTPRLRLLDRLGNYWYRRNNLAEAVRVFETQVREAERNHDSRYLLGALTNLGSAQRRMGRSNEALKQYERAVKLAKDSGESDLRATVFLNAATAFADVGRHLQSKELCEQAIALLKADPEQRIPLTIATINLGCAYFALHNLDDAETSMIEALNLARGKLSQQEAVALGHLGMIRFQQNRITDAIHYLKRALTISHAEGDLWNEQHWHRDIANVYLWTEHRERAEEHLVAGLALAQKIGDLRSIGQCLLAIGLARSARGSTDARGPLLEAWSIFEKTGNISSGIECALKLTQEFLAEAVDLPSITDSITAGRIWELQMAGKLRNQQALDTGLEWLQRARNLAKRTDLDVGESIAEYEAQVLRLQGRSLAALKLLLKGERSTKVPMARLERNAFIGSIYAQDLAQPETAMPYFEDAIRGYEEIADDLEQWEHRLTMRNKYVGIYFRLIDCAVAAGDTEKAFLYCEQSKLGELRRLWQLRGEMPPARRSLLETIGILETFDETVLVEIVPGLLKTFVFIVSKHLAGGCSILRVDGVDGGVIAREWIREAAAYEAFRSPAAVFDDTASQQWQAAVDESCEWLNSRVLDGALKVLRGIGARRVIFVPHSILHCFPLHAVATPEGGTWSDDFEIVYAPSASVLNRKTHVDGSERRFVGFADSLGDLPIAQVEALQANILMGASGDVHIGADVSRGRVVSALETATWVHFACHAKQQLADPLGTGIYIAGNDESSAGEILDLFTINRDIRIRKGTGVVLSACEGSAPTPHLCGETLSIASGFIAARAAFVVSTLWKVNDATAALTTRRFYTLLANGKNAARSLREAQQWLRRLNESEAFEEWETMVNEVNKACPKAMSAGANPFSKRRIDVYPFRQRAEWAAFSMTTTVA